MIEKLKSIHSLIESNDHEMVLPTCSRTGDVIETMLREQWFVNSTEVFKICGTAVESGSLKLTAKFRSNLWNYYAKHFIQKDWCISRQLW